MEQRLGFLATDFWQKAPWGLDLAQVQGRDPLSALQKILSADLRGLDHGRVRKTLLLHPKGQFRALLAVGVWHDEVWLLAPQGWGKLAWEQLSRYLQFSRCHLVPWNGPRTVLVGTGWSAALGGAFGPGENAETPVFAETLTGLPGGVVLADVGDDRGEAEPQELERARIQVGFPAWGRELTEDVLPQEAGLRDPWVSLNKGCYVGQETMARLATYGHVNRLLVRLTGPAPGSWVEDMGPLPWALTALETAKPAGRLTSWASGPERGLLALALVHRRFAQKGQELEAHSVRFTVQAVLA